MSEFVSESIPIKRARVLEAEQLDCMSRPDIVETLRWFVNSGEMSEDEAARIATELGLDKEPGLTDQDLVGEMI